ncbi:hypothetical protein [Methylocystis sp.]|uniref:hypothetical protein n=1 Tax=Methylocystis sp. TaxID=1911079 RepID=UPI0025F02ED0|nr:hypothetical protein [Methylocystis sp.]
MSTTLLDKRICRRLTPADQAGEAVWAAIRQFSTSNIFLTTATLGDGSAAVGSVITPEAAAEGEPAANPSGVGQDFRAISNPSAAL